MRRFQIALLFLTLVAGRAFAGGLTTLHNPDGGDVVFGPFDGKGSSQAAMIAMLKNVHGHFGAKPTVGRFFQSRGGSVVATFFHLTATKSKAGKMSGLVIVSAPTPTTRSAAVVYDSSARFSHTFSGLMKTLSQHWNPAGLGVGTSPSKAGSDSGRAAKLEKFSFPDGTGSIGVPEGWRVIAARGGAVHLAGPKGEVAVFNDSADVIDPSTQQGLRSLRMLTSNGMQLRGTTCAGVISADPARNFVSIRQQFAQRNRAAMPTFKINSETELTPNGKVRRFKLVGTVDNHDGLGVKIMNAVIRILPTTPSSWSMFINQINVPEQLMAEETPTLVALSKSFYVNGKAVMAGNEQVVADIHAAGEAQKKKFEAQWDESSRQAQGFCNVIRENAVIGVTGTDAHATTTYDLADELVRENPDQLELIPPSKYIKGTDF